MFLHACSVPRTTNQWQVLVVEGGTGIREEKRLNYALQLEPPLLEMDLNQ